MAPTIGAFDENGLFYVLQELRDARQVRPSSPGAIRPVVLMFLGGIGIRVTEVACRAPIAFMAMPFNDALLDQVFTECFSPAASRAGFGLRKITDNQPAGLIDDPLRVAIEKSRFLISELTKGNPGAYREAGYAEGLGKPD